jgi:hypothetical protein
MNSELATQSFKLMFKLEEGKEYTEVELEKIVPAFEILKINICRFKKNKPNFVKHGILIPTENKTFQIIKLNDFLLSLHDRVEEKKTEFKTMETRFKKELEDICKIVFLTRSC